MIYDRTSEKEDNNFEQRKLNGLIQQLKLAGTFSKNGVSPNHRRFKTKIGCADTD